MATSITSGKRTQLVRFAVDAARKAAEPATEVAIEESGLDDAAAQRVIERGDEFAEAVRAAVQTVVAEKLRELSVYGQFAREETPSTFDYPPEYQGVRGLDEQAVILRAALPGLGDYDHVFASTLGKVDGTEGPFLVARPEKVAPSYGEAVERMFRLLAASRTFTNYREGRLGEQYLRQHAHSVAMLERACRVQQGDLLVLPGQFGKLHAGRSMRRSRELFSPNEWGGGAFATACMILTHPTRFVRWEQLHVFCPGDEYAPEADGRFVHAPYFYCSYGKLEFRTRDVSDFYEDYGSVSARLPE